MFDVDGRWRSVHEQLVDRDIEHSLRHLPKLILAGAALALAGLTTAVVVDEIRGGDMVQACTTDAAGVEHCE
jgi:hypothetical protein